MVIVGGDQLAAPHQRLEARAGLDRQLIEREVAGAEAERAGQLRLPLAERLTGPGIDQVERYAAEMLLRSRQRAQPLIDAMRTAEKAERRIVERLQAE